MDEIITLLGFFNRNNTGDDAYVECFRSLFPPNILIRHYCTDDISKLPDDTTIVICGGGDIINEYFMDKVKSLIADFTGPVYAVSVGIPYASEARYLKMFDHVFVRSQNDYHIACNEIGSKNVSLTGDLTTMMRLWPTLRSRYIAKPSQSKTRVALCLAQPVFNKNDSLQDDLLDVLKQYPNHEFHLLAFNYNSRHKEECDHIINSALKERLPDNVIIPDIQQTPFSIILYMNEHIDLCVCMRYHSVMFGLLANKRVLPLFCSQKVKNLVQDTNIKDFIEINHESYSFDKEKLSNYLQNPLTIPIVEYLPSYSTSFTQVKEHILIKATKHHMIRYPFESIETTIAKCITNLSKYFNMSLADAEWLINHVGTFVSPQTSKQPIDIARFICYTITGSTDHACLWGLITNMKYETFCLREAIKFIYEDVHKGTIINDQTPRYLPHVHDLKRQCFIKVDSFLRNNYASYHRSGWAYCIAGLQHIDSTMLERECTSSVYIDTYVDRTFHWGYDTMKAIGAIPYTVPWMGFIHHTFDTTHSMYNTTILLENRDFIESLKMCKGLIVLTEYLAKQLRSRLVEYNIPVHVLCHPTEFVEKTFSMREFMNTQGSIVQIGAWLRNPYSIYSLHSPLLKKKALRGKEMDLYFPPATYEEAINNLATTPSSPTKTSTATSICRCFHNINKFVHGAVDHLKDHLVSVEVIEKLSNEAYDDLLEQNIVFLDLVDCSAVNTVIECIVRHTPVIVRRHPALEEILGTDYPGFYTTLHEASSLIQSYMNIYEIHLSLIRLDKTRFTLSNFLESFQQILVPPKQEKQQTQVNSAFMKRFQLISKFLPARFNKHFQYE